ncbi:MAG: hypothetical protein HOV68_17730 [Streptomycetaceae bacterium]|nr:hypothetical protein [Streptomycetaceae bacterium]
MTTEIVKYSGPAASLPEKMDYARALAESGMLPQQYRRQPANLLYALEYADSLGLHPMAAITGIHVIEGRPSASASLISALVRRAGHKLRVKGNDTTATAQIVRADDPEYVFECTWTLERAAQAGLCKLENGRPRARSKKGEPLPWERFPAAMLKARAITEVAREACEEALAGVHYTPEELGAVVDQDGNPVDADVRVLRTVDATPTRPEQSDDFTPHQAAQKLAVRAAEATTRHDVTLLAAEAKDSIPPDARIEAPDTSEPDTLRAYLARRWKALPEQADEVIEGEIVTDPPDEAAAAEKRLRAAAKHAQIDPDVEFEASYGLPIAQAGTTQLNEFAALLEGAA